MIEGIKKRRESDLIRSFLTLEGGVLQPEKLCTQGEQVLDLNKTTSNLKLLARYYFLVARFRRYHFLAGLWQTTYFLLIGVDFLSVQFGCSMLIVSKTESDLDKIAPKVGPRHT